MNSKYKSSIALALLGFFCTGCSKSTSEKAETQTSAPDAKPSASTAKPPVDTLKDVAAESGNSKVIGGTRWEYFERKIADGSMQATAQIHASDDNFQDLPAVLIVACQSTGAATVWIESDDISPAATHATYTVDSAPPVDIPSDIRRGARSLVIGASPLAKSIYAAKTISVDYRTDPPAKGPKFFLVSGFTDLKPKLQQRCPQSGL